MKLKFSCPGFLSCIFLFVSFFHHSTLKAQVINTYAGNGVPGYSGDGGADTSAQLNYPAALAKDAAGNLYIADEANNRIRKVTATGIITTIAGTGTAGYSGDGGAATAAKINSPQGIAIDNSGNIFVADYGNNRIRRITTSGTISTFAGSGTSGFSGDGGPATAAQLSEPTGIAIDASGNMYFADSHNNRIRSVSTSGIISTFAGTGIAGFSGDGGSAAAAKINQPYGLAFDASGNLYIADQMNNRIRKVTTSGTISTIAGTGTGGYNNDSIPATAAWLFAPTGVAIGSHGDIFIADNGNNCIRKVTSSGIINTYCGYPYPSDGSAGSWGDGGLAFYAALTTPKGIIADTSGYVYIADNGNSRVRMVSPASPLLVLTADSLIFTSCVLTGAASPGLTITLSGSYLSPASGSITVTSPRCFVVSPDGSTWGSSYTISYTGGALAASTVHVRFQPDSGATFVENIGISGGGAPSDSIYVNASSAAPYVPAIFCSFTDSINTSICSSLSDAAFYGNWSSSDSSVAIAYYSHVYYYDYIDHNTATLRGMAAGTATITYSVTNSCGTGFATYVVHVADAPCSIITTLAGNGSGGYSGDGGTATTSELYNPSRVVVSGDWVYIADQANNRIRKVDAEVPWDYSYYSWDDIINTIAGNGTSGYSGDGGPATAASLNDPGGIVFDNYGNLYIADQGNNRVRFVDFSTGIITTVAGTGTASYGGDGGPATAAYLNGPTALAVDGYNNLYIADAGNSRIRKVNYLTGIVTTFAGVYPSGFSGDGGGATAAQLSYPNGLNFDVMGNLYIADVGNYRVRRINSAGIISTFAGNGTAGFSGDGGPATDAEFNSLGDLYADNMGNVFIADPYNHRIRKVATSGVISTVAGNGTAGFSGDGGSAAAAELNLPNGIFVDGLENMYITDIGTQRLRKVTSGMPLLTELFAPDAVCTSATPLISDDVPGGKWYTSAPSVASIDSITGAITPLSAGIVFFSYVATNSCGSNGLPWQLYVGTPAAMPSAIGGASVACLGVPAALTDSSAGGVWSSINTGIATINPSTGVVTGLSAGEVVVSYTQTPPLIYWTADSSFAFHCATRSATAVINIIAGAPSAPDSIRGASTVCAMAVTTFTDSTPGGAWSSSLPSVATVDTSGNVTGVAAGSATISYILTNSCGSSYMTKAITVMPLPTVTAISGSSGICRGASVTFTDATSGGTWSVTNSLATISGAVVHGLSTGIDTVAYTVTNSCGHTVAIFPLSINDTPSAGTITGSPSVCIGSSTTLSASVTAGSWSLSNTLGTISGAVFTGHTSGIDTIYYTVSNSCGSAIAPFPVTILPYLTPSVSCSVAPGDTVCTGDSVTFTPVPVNGGSAPVYKWIKFSTMVATGPSYRYLPINGDVIYCSMISSYQCASPDTVRSSAHTMVVDPVVTPVDTITSTVPGDSVSVIGQSVTFYSNITYCGSSPSYQWYMNGVAIPGATSHTLTYSVYHNDTAYCVINCSTPCATSPIDTSNTLVIYADYLTADVQGINSSTSSLSLYPDPNNGRFILAGTLKGISENAVQYQIIDVLGKVCYTGVADLHNTVMYEQIDLANNFAPGQYYIKLKTAANVAVLHFIIE